MTHQSLVYLSWIISLSENLSGFIHNEIIAETLSFTYKEIKNIFLFGCYTGLRFSDIRTLKWTNIKDGRIQLTQTKTKGTVYILLGKNAERILELQRDNTEFVFDISRYSSSVNKTLKSLIDKSSIEKDVTFHSSRHTFATFLISSGVNVYTVSKLLGHKSLKTTEIYSNIIDEKKKQAIDNLPVMEVK